MTRSLVASILLLSTTCARLSADDWPAWRGPTGQGFCAEKNIPVEWGAKDKVKWKIKLAHPGYSTPIIWKNKIFLTSAIEGGKVRSLYCLDRSDGKQLWNADVDYADKEQTWQNYPYCHASPTSDSEHVVVCFGSAGLYCYSHEGKEIWKRTDLGPWQHQFGNGASPVLYNDLAIMWCGPNDPKGRNFLLAVDKKTGVTVWEQDESYGSWSTPLIVKVGGQDQLILGQSPEAKNSPQEKWNFLKGFDPKTGKPLWQCRGLSSYNYTSPIFGNGVAVAMSGYGGSALAVKLGGTGDITKDRLWLHPTNNQRVGSGMVVGDHVYMVDDNGVPHCYELMTGKDLWKEVKRPSDSNTWGSMVHADGRLYVLMRNAETLVFAANPKFELLASNSLGGGEQTNSSLAISNGEIFIRTFRHLWCIGEKQGK